MFKKTALFSHDSFPNLRPLDADFAAAETRRSVENNCLSQHLQALGFLAGQWHRRACADTRLEVTYPSCSNYESLGTGAL